MGLSSELIDQLVKVTQNTEPRDKDNTAYGTVVVMGSKKYVKIDGSDLMTPVSSTVAVENGDRVIVTIKNHSATVTGNTTSPAASNKKVTELGTKISDFEIVIADKVSAKELDVQIGRIDDLTADNATIKETLIANKASIDDLTAKNAEITGTLEANKAKIDDLDAKKLDAEVADIKYASVERLDATDANLRNLKSDYAQFEKTTTGELEATNAKIDGLDTKYANVDFSNIGKAAIERFYATSGIIKDLVVGDQTITGELVGITITGDLIKGNTVVADKLVIKGSDGLYYKLNTDGVITEKEQTEYNSLNGQIIQAKSITATKIDVKDLVAFGATIGGFNIGQDSIFSGVKETVDSKSRGIYMDKNGQIAIGDVNNYIKYFKDTDGKYRLKISAASLEFNASGDSGEESKDLETVIKDINDRVNGIAETNKGIGSITNYYLATSASSGVTTETTGWTTKIQNVSSSKKYLWNYEVTKYTDDTVANTTEPCIIGMYSAVGATGNGIQKITEYYALSALKDSVPTVWSENVPNLTATNKYLWNYEEILYTNGGTELTKKRIIGVYGDTGKDGAKGEKGDTGAKGVGVSNVDVMYYKSTSATSLSGGSWVTTDPGWENGKYIWSKTVITYTDKTTAESTPVCITGAKGSTGGTGAKGETGADGKGVTSIVEQYYQSTSSTSLTGGSWSEKYPGWVNGKYIWTRSVITYTDKTSTTTTAVCVTGAKGSTGNDGKSIGSVTNYYLATSASSGVKTSTSGWTTTVQNVTLEKKYLWNYEVVKYSDGTVASTTSPCIIGTYGDTGKTGATGAQGYSIVTNITRDNRTEADWEKYSAIGYVTDLSNTQDQRNGCRIGDIFTVTGTATDTKNGHVAYYRSDTASGQLHGTCISHTVIPRGETGNNALQVLKQWNGTYTTIGQEVNCPIDRFNRTPVTGDMFTNVDASSNLGTWQITKVADGQAYFKMVSYVSAKGATGATGNGIKSIKEHYAVSTSNTVTPTTWFDDVPITNPVNKYLWNYETITYTNGTSVDSNKRVIGVYGDTGKDGAKGEKGDDFNWNLSPLGELIAYSSATLQSYDKSTNTYTVNYKTTSNVYGNGLQFNCEACIPYGQKYRASAEIYSPMAGQIIIDINNAPAKGSVWNGNDNDRGEYRTKTVFNIPANTWTKIMWGSENTHAKNTNEVDLLIADAIGFKGPTETFIWYLRNPKIELGDKATPWTPCKSDLKGETGARGATGDNLITVNAGNPRSNWDGLQEYSLANDPWGASCVQYPGKSKKPHLMLTDYTPFAFRHADRLYYNLIVPNWSTTTYSAKVYIWFYDGNKNYVDCVGSENSLVLTAQQWNSCEGFINITKTNLQSVRYYVIGIENPNHLRIGICNGSYIERVDTYAAKTATNFMEFTSGTGLQIGDKTNGSWKGFRSRITSTAFEILNEAGTAVASYGRKLIQLGKDSTDAVIELCGGKGTIKYENVWLYGGEDDTLTINAENMAILSDKNIVIRAKRVTADNIRITNQLFMSDDSIHITMYEMNADLPDEADDCIAGIDIDKKSGINLETLGVTDKALTGVSINGRSLLNHIYPVGSIYMSTSATNPSNFFGGTWVAWGAGRVPVGFNGSDGNFNSSEKTGGSKTINISHSHTVNSHKHIAATGYDENNYYSGVQWGTIVLPSYGYAWGANRSVATNPIRLSYTSPESPGTNAQLSGSQSILQPYITCYMWKRTA